MIVARIASADSSRPRLRWLEVSVDDLGRLRVTSVANDRRTWEALTIDSPFDAREFARAIVQASLIQDDRIKKSAK